MGGEVKKKIKGKIRKKCEQIRQKQKYAQKGELEMINKIKAWERESIMKINKIPSL
jgi:hypothetical protein